MVKRKFKEYDMYYNSYLVIRKRYPYSQGFVIKIQDGSKEGYRPDYLIQKQIHYAGTTYYYKVIFEVKAEAVIKPQHITQINWYAKNDSGKHSYIIAKYLVIPTYSNIDRVKNLIEKSGISIIRLRSFER